MSKTRYFTKKYITYFLILLAGLVLGWLFFGGSNGSSEKESANTSVTNQNTVWTCSMHPQIRQNEPGKCPICGMDLIPLNQSGGSGEANPFIHEMSPEAVALANIRTTKVGQGNATTGIENEITLTGKVQPDEQKLATIAAKFPGRIEQLYVNFTGQNVSRGMKLLSIYSPELVTAQQELLQAAKTKETNQSLYEAAKDKLRLWKLSEQQISNIENNKKLQTRFDVLADRSGYVTNRLVSAGDYVDMGTPLMEVTDLSTVWIMLDAYESDLSLLKQGSKVEFTVSALGGKKFTGTVSFIDPVINPATRTAAIRVQALNPGLEIKPGMFVNATLTTKTAATKTDAILVPKTAVLWTGPRSVVYVKVPDREFPAFEMREVTLGAATGNLYIIESGLKAGEEIVTNGVFSIDAAAQLSGNYSMMNKPEVKTFDAVPEAFRTQLTAVADAYFDLQKALLASDAAKASNAAKKLKEQLQKVDMKQLSAPAHDQWMTLLKPMQENTDKIIANSKDLKAQRKAYSALSDHLIEAVEYFGLQKPVVYKAFCPMALDDKGAHWLSETSEVLNPYYGDEMLSCGEIQKTYKKGEKVYKTESGTQTPIQEHQH